MRSTRQTGCLAWAFRGRCRRSIDARLRSHGERGGRCISATRTRRSMRSTWGRRARVEGEGRETSGRDDDRCVTVTNGRSTCRCRRSKKARRHSDLRVLHVPRQHCRARCGDGQADVEDVHDCRRAAQPDHEEQRRARSCWGRPAAACGRRRRSTPIATVSTSRPATTTRSPAAPESDAIMALRWIPGAWSGLADARGRRLEQRLPRNAGRRGTRELPSRARARSRLLAARRRSTTLSAGGACCWRGRSRA